MWSARLDLNQGKKGKKEGKAGKKKGKMGKLIPRIFTLYLEIAKNHGVKSSSFKSFFK